MTNPLRVNGKFKLVPLLFHILIPLVGGRITGAIISNTLGQYDKFIKPFFSPPSWIFSIVWTILYILMGLAAYRIYLIGESGGDSASALFFYYLQLLMNFLWSFLFFSFRLYGIAFMELIFLFILVVITFINFVKTDKLAGFLLPPYLLWLIYAGALNFFIWLLNEA